MKPFHLLHIFLLSLALGILCLSIPAWAKTAVSDLISPTPLPEQNISTQNQPSVKAVTDNSSMGDELDLKKIVLKNPFISKLPSAEKPPVAPEQPDIPISVQQPNQPAPPAKPSMKISGLIWNTDRPQAIINGQVVNIGDVVSGWTISKISKKGIVVKSQETTFLIEP